jgi:hypothetical protein
LNESIIVISIITKTNRLFSISSKVAFRNIQVEIPVKIVLCISERQQDRNADHEEKEASDEIVDV